MEMATLPEGGVGQKYQIITSSLKQPYNNIGLKYEMEIYSYTYKYHCSLVSKLG